MTNYPIEVTSNQQRFDLSQTKEALLKSQEFGFISNQSIEKQINHSLAFIDQWPKNFSNILDLGAGGGLPSLVYLALDQNNQITALEAMRKRCEFLTDIISIYSDLESRFKVENARAEEMAKIQRFHHGFDLVVARGFGTPQITAECATGFLKIGGQLVVSGRPDEEIERWDDRGLNQLGLKVREVTSRQESHAVHIEKVSWENPKYPRRSAAMKNTPLW